MGEANQKQNQVQGQPRNRATETAEQLTTNPISRKTRRQCIFKATQKDTLNRAETATEK